jgi:hypothetical protein
LALAVLLEQVIQREAQEALPLLLVLLEALALLATQEALVMVAVAALVQHLLEVMSILQVVAVKVEPKVTLVRLTEPAVTAAADSGVVQVEALDLTVVLVAQAYMARVAVAGPVEIILVALAAMVILKFGSIRNESSKN